MALYVADITFLDDKKLEHKQRPEPMSVAIRAKTLDLAAKRVAKFAKRRWTQWRFDVRLLDCDLVLK